MAGLRPSHCNRYNTVDTMIQYSGYNAVDTMIQYNGYNDTIEWMQWYNIVNYGKPDCVAIYR